MTLTPSISLQLQQAFVQSIAQKIGIKIRQVEQDSFVQKIWLRTKALKLATPEQYYQLLNLPGFESEQEWQNLAELLTNNESYFFRDRQQLNLLKERILPQLIGQKRQQGNLTLRIWSAGCSTGQEPYSLAIILKELLFDLAAWNLTIFGTDIDSAALNKARTGIYSNWSFRDTESRIKQQYFKPIADNYQIEPSISEMVTFQRLNLLSDRFPQLFSDLREIDLIVCRNVFIYFGLATVGDILAKFYDTLKPEGYLLVGHSELSGQNLGGFQAQVFPQSLIYQRRELNSSAPSCLSDRHRSTAKTTKKNNSVVDSRRLPTLAREQTKPQPSFQRSPNRIANTPQPALVEADGEKLLEQAKHLCLQKQFNLAIKKVEQILAMQPQNVLAYCLLGKIYLGLNRVEEAVAMSDRALAIDSVNLEANYLLAEIALHQNEADAAKKILKKILYLDPASIKAPFELHRIYARAGDRPRANKMRQQVMKLLQKLPNSKTIPTCNNLTVAELIFQLKATA